MATKQQICEAVSKSLVEFGYPDATPDLITDIYDAYKGGKAEKDMPHGILGAFAYKHLADFEEAGGELPA